VRSSAKADTRRAAVLAAAAAVWLGSALARAEVIYDVAPAAGVGYTNNPRLAPTNAVPPPEGDEMTIVSGSVRARYLGARSDYGAGYRLSWTHFLHHRGIDDLSNELSALGNLMLSSKLDLHLTASGVLSRTSRINTLNPAAGVDPQGIVNGSYLFLGLNGSEELVYHPNARWQYTETIGATRVHYLDAGAPPDSLIVNFLGRSDLITGIDSYSLQGNVGGTIANVNSVIAELLAGWRREISVQWTTELQLGVMGIFLPNRSPIIGPAGNATLGYRRILWFATLNLSRIPSPNVVLGSPTVNNQAVLRLTLPLTRDETAVVSGQAGYLFANPADAQFTRAFDQRTASVDLGSRFGKLPLYGTIEYTVLSQHGGSTSTVQAQDIFRWSLTLNIRALFTFGPGTPPILGAPI
jgi:hypothetical protein